MSYHSSFSQRVYFAAPYPLKVALASLHGIRERRRRYGGAFAGACHELEDFEQADPDTIAAAQEGVFAGFLADAVRHTSYYRNRSEYRSVRGLEDLAGSPILEKRTVQSERRELHRDGYQSLPHVWGHTSGTTGRGLTFPISLSAYQREYAFRCHHYGWGDVHLSRREPVCFCSGHPVAYHDRRRPPFWVHDRANRWLLLSSYHLTLANLPAYIRRLESFAPTMLAGYPSSLYLLARAYQQYGSGSLTLRSVFTASETLFDHQRDALRQAFGVKVFNWYGNSELCGLITECEQGRLHVRGEHSLLEVLDDRGHPCSPGETGRVIGTGFHNRLFPLIRYDVGDRVTLSTETQCPCGRHGRLVERIDGRREAYIATPDGRLVGRLDHLFKDRMTIAEAQLVQRDRSEVLFRIVKNADYDVNEEQELVRRARLRLGSNIRIRFEYPDRIERGPHGKFPFIRSDLDQADLVEELVDPAAQSS